MRFIVLACLLVNTALASAQVDSATIVNQLKAYHYGGDSSAVDAVAKWVADSRGNPVEREKTARALAEVAASRAASVEARAFACRQLALIGSDAQLPALIPLLADTELGHYAMIALAAIPGKSVDSALMVALDSAHGPIRREIIDTLGERRVSAAIPGLTRLLAAPGEDWVAAGVALAKMTDPRAAQSLMTLKAKDPGIIVEASDKLLRAGDRASAARLISGVSSPADSAVAAGLLRIRVLSSTPPNFTLLVEALSKDGTLSQSMAARLAREIPGREVTATLASELSQLTPHGQAILLGALPERADAIAGPATLNAESLMKVTAWNDSEVRMAGLRALGLVGDVRAIPVLLDAAASGTAAEAEIARTSLARIRGQGVDARLLSAVETGKPEVRIQAIRAIGERNIPGLGPRLMAIVGGQPAAVKAAAYRVLRESAGPEQVPTFLGLLLAAPREERDGLEAAVAEIARRGVDEAQRTGPILEKLGTVSSPADKAELLTILGQVGGTRALTALMKAAEDSNVEIRTAAVQQLAEWPTDEPLTLLSSLARDSQNASLRSIALRGYVRLIGINEQRPAESALSLYRQAGSLAKTPADRRLVLSGLGQLRSIGALKAATEYLSDPDVRAEAQSAVVEIGQGTAGAYRDETRASLEPIVAQGATDEIKARAKTVLDLISKFGDFIMAWEVSPAYQAQGITYDRLFGMPFPPESGGAVAWRPLSVGTNPDQPWLLDLLAALGGEQRVAYLRTNLWSDSERDIVLECGSDDGIRVWWNGQLVHSNNTARAVVPGQEKVKVHAKAGKNEVLLKVTQNNQGWGACVRATNPDSSPTTGLKARIPGG